MDYQKFNDYELLSYVKENNEEANNILFDKYKNIINKTAFKMAKYCKNSGLEQSDLAQEGYYGLSLAIENFDETMDNSFYTYAVTCIERKMISAIIASNRQKHKILNESVSLEKFNEDDDLVEIESLLVDNSFNPENIILDNDDTLNLIEKIEKILTDFETTVFELKISNFSYKEIADILDKDPKSIDNAIQRIKIKIKKELGY